MAVVVIHDRVGRDPIVLTALVDDARIPVDASARRRGAVESQRVGMRRGCDRVESEPEGGVGVRLEVRSG